MSTKTLRKRVALATVAALGAGVLSLVSTTAANAVTSTAGSFTIVANGGSGSSGLLGTGSTAGTPDLLTATLLTTGTLKIATNAPYGSYITVSAGAYISGGATSNVESGQTADSSTVSANTWSITPTGAAGSTFTVNGYTSKGGTLVTNLVVTIAATSVAGTVSAAKSYVSWSGDPAVTALTADVTDTNATTTGKPLYALINLNDAYGNDITSTSGALTVTASTGAYVSLAAPAGSISSGTYTTAVSALSPASIAVKVVEATAGAGWSGTITVNYNGVAIATKTGSISGYVSKLTGAATAVGHTSAQIDTALSYQAYDAAGNVVVVAATAIALDSASTLVTAVANKADNTTTTAGILKVTSGSTAGTASVILDYTRPDGAVVKSAPISFLVGGAAASHTATLDKSNYAPGDIATLKIKFLDSKGNVAASDSSIYTQSSSSTANYAWNLGLTTPQLTQVGTAGQFPTASQSTYGNVYNIAPDQNGVITIKYTVGTTTGSFNAIVDVPTVGGAAQTVSYKIASGDTSLNDVLKGIVSLIASINKQIAALAKLVTKKK